MASTSESNKKTNRDEYFIVDEAKTTTLYDEISKGRRDDSLDSRYLKKVCLAGTAALKILSHGQSGIIEGMKDPEKGMPLEVMGVLSGHILDNGKKDTLVVTDAFPVPAKGGAHSVQEDPRTSDHMFYIQADIEKMQPGDRLVGWYHSHPFDPNDAENGHCWFSETDVQNQNQWQNMFEAGAGIPFVGIVVDPLNSIQRNQLMMAAFRNYPPSYELAQTQSRCPDGRVISDTLLRHQLWGQAWASYYRVELELFTTSLMAHVMEIIQKDAMWAALLSQSKLLDPAFQKMFPARLDKLVTEAQRAQSSIQKRPPLSLDSRPDSSDLDGPVAGSFHSDAHPASSASSRQIVDLSIADSELGKTAKASDFIAYDFIHAQFTQHCKSVLFP